MEEGTRWNNFSNERCEPYRASTTSEMTFHKGCLARRLGLAALEILCLEKSIKPERAGVGSGSLRCEFVCVPAKKIEQATRMSQHFASPIREDVAFFLVNSELALTWPRGEMNAWGMNHWNKRHNLFLLSRT